MAGILKTLTSWARKSTGTDWGTLERYILWASGGPSASGIIVSPNTAMQSAAVYSCIKVLAESIGMLPLNVYSGNEDNRVKAKNHPLWDILHDQPNDWQTSTEFFELMIVSLCLRGNAYAYKNVTRSGVITELLPLHPDMIRVEMNGFQLQYIATMSDGTTKYFGPGEIFHIRGLTMNGWLGISPIAYARESIGLALATEKFGSQLFRNGAKMGGVLEHPGKLSDEAYKRLKNSFDDASSGDNAHKTALLEEGAKFNKVSMNADDAQFLLTRQYQRSEIAGIFRVPPHMIGDLSNATFSNIENLGLQFINYTLMPWLNRIEKCIKRDLMTPADRKELSIKFNAAMLLRGDATARAAYYNSGIMAGWLTRADARQMESDMGFVLNAVPGLEVPLMPLNMTDGTDDPDEADDVADGETNTEAAVKVPADPKQGA